MTFKKKKKKKKHFFLYLSAGDNVKLTEILQNKQK